MVQQSTLEELAHFFSDHNIDVVGGIATVPGENFGVKQEGQLGWFNWQDPKTQNDLRGVVKMAASVFDAFIVDDFLCTGDTSLISKQARGSRSWSSYRMDLLTQLSNDVFIKPAKEINPDISMIIKYPQWYDRFHLFGYDVERKSDLFDQVWVGTETRGQYTPKFGFVQPYEGFVSFRWMHDIAGRKMTGAWFDHIDCDQNDFIEQAWQTVLAGAKEIVFFNYYNFIKGHPGHPLLRTQYNQLADLAAYVAKHPVEGITAYKPPSSGAGGDLYLMDYLGMIGIPLIPSHQYPENAKAILLPTQAAQDKDIYPKIKLSLQEDATLIFTSGFIANALHGRKIAKLAGIKYPVVLNPGKAVLNPVGHEEHIAPSELEYEAHLELSHGESLLSGTQNSRQIPYLIKSKNHKVYTINTHTFSQKDFEEAGEVLLCPKSVGLLEIPPTWANILRNELCSALDFDLLAPTRIAVQPMGEKAWVFHNYNQTLEEFTFIKKGLSRSTLVNAVTNQMVKTTGDTLRVTLSPRSRIWIKSIDK